jgi:putative AdoMet-dependent methyltransferase
MMFATYTAELQLGFLFLSTLETLLLRSEFLDRFNHDQEAPGYDEDVGHEEHPVRSGYSSLLSWIGRQVRPCSTVLELGSGTGNTILALPSDCRVTAVDISTQMTERAKAKLKTRSITYKIEDILEFVDESSLTQFDAIISSYALHHLTADERRVLFTMIYAKSKDSVTVAIGDLMYKNDRDRARILRKYRVSYPGVAEGFDEEFYWSVTESDEILVEIGWKTTWQQFSDLSWAVRIEKL